MLVVYQYETLFKQALFVEEGLMQARMCKRCLLSHYLLHKIQGCRCIFVAATHTDHGFVAEPLTHNRSNR